MCLASQCPQMFTMTLRLDKVAVTVNSNIINFFTTSPYAHVSPLPRNRGRSLLLGSEVYLFFVPSSLPSPTVSTCSFWVMLTKHWLPLPHSPVDGLFQSHNPSGTSSLLLLDCRCLSRPFYSAKCWFMVSVKKFVVVWIICLLRMCFLEEMCIKQFGLYCLYAYCILYIPWIHTTHLIDQIVCHSTLALNIFWKLEI